MNSKETLLAFFDSMSKWEVQRYKKTKLQEYKNNIDRFRDMENDFDRKALSEILSKYLTKKALGSIGAPALDTLGAGNPPVYDQSIIEEDLDASSHKYICASNNGALLGSILKYTLVDQDGNWRIDNIHGKHANSPATAWKKRASV